jgi:hypothetical protein
MSKDNSAVSVAAYGFTLPETEAFRAVLEKENAELMGQANSLKVSTASYEVHGCSRGCFTLQSLYRMCAWRLARGWLAMGLEATHIPL